jgi:hypothetical protein
MGRSGTKDVRHIRRASLSSDLRLRLTELISAALAGPEQVGSYHYCSGVEASSSASLAAYLNSLTFAVEEGNAWFSKGPVWKVRGGTYWSVCQWPDAPARTVVDE